MGRIINESSNLKMSKKKATEDRKKPKVNKPAVKITVKRLSSIKQRIANLLAERHSWETKNKQLSDSLKDEKIANATLHKELFEYKKLHHESIVSLNSYIMKHQQIKEFISTYGTYVNPHSHLIAIAECLTNIKITFNKIDTVLSSGDQNNVHCRQIDDSSNNYCHSKSNKVSEPVGRVGPMVKGHLISKPHIRLERVMLPAANDTDADIQEAGANASAEELGIALSPIQEEQEEIPLRQISYRRKKARLGTKTLRRDKPNEDSHDSQVSFDISTNNSTASNSPLMNRMEHVAVTRLEDLNRLLHNSSLMQVDSSQLEPVARSNVYKNTDEKLYRKSQVQVPSDDPLEGCSWMSNNYRSSIRESQPTHVPARLDSSDDDDDVDEILLPSKKQPSPYTSPLPNPLMNSTANSSSRTYVIKKSNESDSFKSNDNCSSPAAEPDSTSHITLRDVSSKLFVSADNFTISKSISAEYSSLHRESLKKQRNKSSVIHNSIKINERLPIDEDLEERTPETLEKRKRKPKNHAYPGEEEFSPKHGKLSSERLSVGKKLTKRKSSVGRKSLEKPKRSLQKKVQQSTKTNISSPKSSSNNKQEKSLHSNASSTANKSKLTSPKSKICKSNKSLKNSRTSLVQETSENVKNNKSYVKRSSKLITPRNSEQNMNCNNESIKEGDDRSSLRSRRNASKKICYKESPLNVKVRRN